MFRPHPNEPFEGSQPRWGGKIWEPSPGSQRLFITCPHREALLEGTRGSGKTETLLFDFAQHTNQGWDADWRGILFRRTYPELTDVIQKTRQWFPLMGATYNTSSHTWTWPDGAQLLLRHLEKASDYWSYHGHQYTWVAFEELCAWPNLDHYEQIKSVLRSARPGVPKKIRATANPYGVGHNAVKAYFIDPAPRGTPIPTETINPVSGKTETTYRIAIHGTIWENKYLLDADPEYVARLQSITDPNLRKAWLEGSWNITAGGMFDDLWREEIHVVDPFRIPSNWRVDRSFDWGDSAPFAALWWAESNGETVMTSKGPMTFPRGTMFMIAEWYGWNGKVNTGCRMLASEIAKGIKEREAAMFLHREVRRGPADTQIFVPSGVESRASIADEMGKYGVFWTEADKGQGSRILGWQKLRELLSASLKSPMERPGLFIFSTCRQTIRTFPNLGRDEKNIEDVGKQEEDHIGDAMRYRVFSRIRRTVTGQFLV